MTAHPDEQWLLRLYVAEQTPKSLTAFANLKKLCEEHLHGQYQIEVIDLAQNPRQARTDEIVVIPTLVRKLPPPSAASSATCPTPNACWWGWS